LPEQSQQAGAAIICIKKESKRMSVNSFSNVTTRREILKAGGLLAGAGLLAGWMPKNLSAQQSGTPAQTAGVSPDQLAQLRAQMASTPLQTLKLRDNIYMFYGPGGNMVALEGGEGKVLVDSSFAPVAPKIRAALDELGTSPLKVLINTHWHFDHTDGNAALHEAGATIIAHENTRKRLSTPQEMRALGLHFPASPAAALPQETFTKDFCLYMNGEELNLGYFSPAHTDTDIHIRYEKGNVLHLGDIWFNGFYPLIDVGTGGSINGMIAAAERGATLADAETKIVPGHGPVGDRATLTKYRDMLAAVRDRVKAQKASGKTLEEVIAAKPTADLDPAWGNGFIKPDFFVTFVYASL
jgi:glyoxylase-like metal-dependent hydrolase (beta-lactamase superfamily II)